VIVHTHTLLEHLVQADQGWTFGWPRHHSLGMLGLLYPWLVHSEWLHYGYALVMLVGSIALSWSFVNRARVWWDSALLIQALRGAPLFSVAQLTNLIQFIMYASSCICFTMSSVPANADRHGFALVSFRR